MQTAYDMDAIRAAPGEPRTSFLGVSDWYLHGFGPAEFDRAVYRALGRTERWAAWPTDCAPPWPVAVPTHCAPRRLRQPGVPRLRGGEPDREVRARSGADAARDRGGHPAHTASRSAAGADRPGGVGLRVPAPPAGPPSPLGNPGAPPVLLVASARDPVTPIEGARRLRQVLPGSRLVTLDDDCSHGVFAGRGNACVDGAVAAHLVDGTVPAADVRRSGPGLPVTAAAAPPR
ncbi:alpha/beta hydrolase [Streptomyces viridochromogenes]|uniref:Peptidase S33 tripeptidyl aminopeptidase-like C-terminal domain-containing protein n=1 Tax=Streptomyces viridochromogenes Tue57 TaxID=1160705 RepID=L8PN30_STRVR|nr:alpha/beta hydrolase [Streptomyces viridochromogenes]ELS57429.1 hypothetical protein STVIR_1646 [Streptomyces viridochromogenes Tue57]